MDRFDGSHDFNHIKRVVGIAHQILRDERQLASESSRKSTVMIDGTVVTLAAMLHDVGDRKYLSPGDNAETMIRDKVCNFEAQVFRITNVCRNFSPASDLRSGELFTLVSRVFPDYISTIAP